jgi:hypothetical protein
MLVVISSPKRVAKYATARRVQWGVDMTTTSLDSIVSAAELARVIGGQWMRKDERMIGNRIFRYDLPDGPQSWSSFCYQAVDAYNRNGNLGPLRKNEDNYFAGRVIARGRRIAKTCGGSFEEVTPR